MLLQKCKNCVKINLIKQASKVKYQKKERILNVLFKKWHFRKASLGSGNRIFFTKSHSSIWPTIAEPKLAVAIRAALLIHFGNGGGSRRLAHRRGRRTPRQPEINGALAFALFNRCKLGWWHILRVFFVLPSRVVVTVGVVAAIAVAAATAAVEIIVESFGRLFYLKNLHIVLTFEAWQIRLLDKYRVTMWSILTL